MILQHFTLVNFRNQITPCNKLVGFVYWQGIKEQLQGTVLIRVQTLIGVQIRKAALGVCARAS